MRMQSKYKANLHLRCGNALFGIVGLLDKVEISFPLFKHPIFSYSNTQRRDHSEDVEGIGFLLKMAATSNIPTYRQLVCGFVLLFVMYLDDLICVDSDFQLRNLYFTTLG